VAPNVRSGFVVLFAVLLLGALSAAQASADPTPVCATTTDSPNPTTPSPGQPCWTDVTPYPFGADGGPVDTSSQSACKSPDPGPDWAHFGDPVSACYLTVESMAFRAWNRGLAATHGTTTGNGDNDSAGFGLWVFNGARWYPDPTFPGHAACPGNTVLWAGKLDYWLIGQTRTGASWPPLCRFDGSKFEWETLPVPATTLARVPFTGAAQAGAITSGACFSWDNCWFFGSYGTMLHWDGENLSDASPGLGVSPWLQGGFTAAIAGTDAAGNPFGFAVSDTGPSDGLDPQQQSPAQPDGSPPPQLWSFAGGAFTPLAFSPQTNPKPEDPYRTDLVGVAADGRGDLWLAGDPIGARPGVVATGPRISSTTQTAPLSLVTESGSRVTCTGPDFTWASAAPTDAENWYAWGTLSAFQTTGDVLAGGQLRSAHGSEPVVVIGGCGQAPAVARFRIRDQTDADQANAALVPADVGGFTTAVAANADNDAWAATTDSPSAFGPVERPHIYRLTDGRPPDAPAGDDNETRPLVFVPEPTQYVISPPVTITTSPPPTHVTQTRKPKHEHLRAAVYGIHHKLTSGPHASFVLRLIFRVRRTVTIGAVGLLHGRVVTSSGLHRFKPGIRELDLTLVRSRWPKQIKFVFPRAKK
jgi:hypothetical protein